MVNLILKFKEDNSKIWSERSAYVVKFILRELYINLDVIDF